MKPCVTVRVGEGHGQQGLPGATVRSTRQKLVKEIREGDDWTFVFKEPGDTLYVEAVNRKLPVTVTNHLTVPLVLEVTFPEGNEIRTLDDVLNHGRRFHLAYGARLKARV